MDALTVIFVIISYLGSEIFYMIILPPLLWLDRKEGKRLLYLVLTAMYSGFLMKELFRMPRPPSDLWLVSDVYGYGFPSGHALLAFAFWGYLALIYLHRNPGHRAFPVLALMFASLVGFSRIYLGVHYTHDVVGGALIGIILASLFYIFYVKDIEFKRYFSQQELKTLSIVISINLYFLGLMSIGEYDFLLIYKLSLLCGVIMGSSYAIAIENHGNERPGKRGFAMRVAIGLPPVFFMYMVPLVISFSMSSILVNIVVKWLQGIMFSITAVYVLPGIFKRYEI